MSTVLAFDLGASSGRAVLAEYSGGKISYREIHRFENAPQEKNGSLRWDLDYLMNEIKKEYALRRKTAARIPWRLTHGAWITDSLTAAEI